MSLMLKLLATSLLLGSIAHANSTQEKVEDFLNDQFSKNSQLKSVDVTVDNEKNIKQLKGWKAYVVNIEARLKSNPKNLIKQKMIWFSNGEVITKDLTFLQSGDNLTDIIKPDFKAKYYKKANLIYGNANAKHKIAIFSDPLCPFCRSFVPGALKEMKKEPNKYAVYYYHLPLLRIHPASAVLVQAAVVAELKGVKEVVAKLYNVKVKVDEKDPKKILKAFNKAMGTSVTLKDLQNPKIKEQIQFDAMVANDIMVAGTPTIYLDGKMDRTKNKYKKVK